MAGRIFTPGISSSSSLMDPSERIPVRSRSRSLAKSSSSVHQGIRMVPSHLTAKPASDWTSSDLDTLRIEMVEVTVDNFFGCAPEDLPMPKFTYPYLEEILTAGCGYFEGEGPPPIDFTVKNFFKLVEDATSSAPEASVDQLAFAVLTHLGYQLISGEMTDIGLQHQMYFEMSHVRTGARADIALLDKIRALVCLYVENKRLASTNNETALNWPHAQVVANCLGAANVNTNDARLKAQRIAKPANNSDLSESLEYDHFDMIIPAFTLCGSLPCFYIIPITSSLTSAVARGEIPPHPTKVFFCIAPVQWSFGGMMIQRQRRLIFQMFEAFKTFIPTNFAELCRFSKLGGSIPKPIDPNYKSNIWNSVEKFLADSDKHLEQQGIDKDAYASTTINYFVGSNGVRSDLRNYRVSSPQHRATRSRSIQRVSVV